MVADKYRGDRYERADGLWNAGGKIMGIMTECRASLSASWIAGECIASQSWVNGRHFVFLCLQGNLILQHVNHNGGLICAHTNIGHILQPSWLACSIFILHLRFQKKEGGGDEQWSIDRHRWWFWHPWFRNVGIGLGLPWWYDLLKRQMIQTNKSTPLPHNSLSLNLLSSSSCCHQPSSFYTHTHTPID